MRHLIILSVLFTLLLSMVGSGFSAQESATPVEIPSNFNVEVRGRLKDILDQIPSNGNVSGATVRLITLFDQVIQFGKTRNTALFSEVGLALRMVRQVGYMDAADRLEMLTYLREHETLAATLVMLVDTKHDQVKEVYQLLDHLRKNRKKLAATYYNLTAAICVVHDQQMVRRINEHYPISRKPLEIFDFYVANEKKMLFGVKNMPANLLVYVVDTTASLKDQKWALKQYGKKRNIGKRFFEIDYDSSRYEKGGTDIFKIKGYSLRSIHKYGGVCVDQAYFAVEIGKAIGAPTTYTVGESSSVGHAWVGFLESAGGGRARWNFNAGRYPEYQGVKGSIIHPQTHQNVADSTLSLEAAAIRVKPSDHRTAVALTDAALRLIALQRAKSTLAAPFPNHQYLKGKPAKVMRSESTEDQLELLYDAIKKDAGYQNAWFVVRDLATGGKLSLKQKSEWAKRLSQVCGTRFPDFTISMLRGIINSLEKPKQKVSVWEKVLPKVKKRHDLAAEVRMEQGHIWEKVGNKQKAASYYNKAVQQYINDGPFALNALIRLEAIMIKAGQQKKLLRLYEKTWGKIKKPTDFGASVFNRQSNWYKVGRRYATLLESEGQKKKYKKINKLLESHLNSE